MNYTTIFINASHHWNLQLSNMELASEIVSEILSFFLKYGGKFVLCHNYKYASKIK